MPLNIEKLYDYLNNEEDPRSCEAISEDARQIRPITIFWLCSTAFLTS